MLDFITAIFLNSWELTAEMAPYLLFGFAVGGLLHLLIRADFIERHLGRPGLMAVAKASLFGVPMPLCSCSVIPVAASLRKSGASRGATASFLSSTPQTGVDSIFATYALLGGVFTVVRVVVAFVSGIVAGYLIELFCRDKAKPTAPDLATMSFSPFTGPEAGQPATKPAVSSCCHVESKKTWREGLRFGFVTLPSDLAGALLFGLLLAGVITTLLPPDLLTGSLSSGVMAFLLATLISLPLYVCATASIPMAYALIAAGLSPGAALVFLITGPATNTATITTCWKMLGRMPTVIYLVSLLLIAWTAGAVFNITLAQGMEKFAHHHCPDGGIALWKHLSALLMTGLLLVNFALAQMKKRNGKAKSCCSS